MLKAYIGKSTGDLKSVFDRFQRYWKHQHQNLLDSEADERDRILHSIQIPLLSGVLGYVYQYALRKIVSQKSRLSEHPPPLPCRCGTPNYMGLPCFHKVYQRLQEEGIVLPEDIHDHWWYTRTYGSRPNIGRQVLPLLNPDVVKRKGRPKGAKGKKNALLAVTRDLRSPEESASSEGRGVFSTPFTCRPNLTTNRTVL